MKNLIIMHASEKINKNFKIAIDKFGKNNHNVTRKMLPDKSVSGGGMTKFITN